MQLIPSIILSFVLFSSASFAMNSGTSSTSSLINAQKNEKKTIVEKDKNNDWDALIAQQRLTSEALAKKQQQQIAPTVTPIPDQQLQNAEDIRNDTLLTDESELITWESLANTSFARSTSTTVNKSQKPININFSI